MTMAKNMAKKTEDGDNMKNATILVVDDNEQNLELLQAYLEDFQCRTIPAKDGVEALEIIKKSKPLKISLLIF